MLTAPLLKSVVVVGGGLAGLSAAIEAYRAGAAVTVLEKESRLGGNSAKATSGMNAASSPHQSSIGIQDSITAFQNDTIKSGKTLSDSSLVRVLTENSVDALSFIESFGVTLNAVSQCGGHSVPRTHREAPRSDGNVAAVGWDVIKALQSYVMSDEVGIRVITGAKVEELIGDEEKGVSGVRFMANNQCQELPANAVILASGGFANDHTDTSLITRHAPHLLGIATTNGPWATGDGVKMGEKIGAFAVDLDKIQIHPTGFVDPKDPSNSVKFLAPESLRGYGGILVDPRTSRRFINELDTRDAVSRAMLERGMCFLLILTDAMVHGFDEAAIKFYMSRGLIEKHETLEQLCKAFNMDVGELQKELTEYNNAGVMGHDRFGKKVFANTFVDAKEFYVARVTPVIHYTMGGLKINERAEIQSRTQSIRGLYGAGEVTGGVHGANRLAGNSLLECVVFGRIAGRNAAGWLMD
ncbi:FAD binding domain-containing protein [Chytridium lagenaria]|nr:FAD binding domain-containing protein [Chytridium lagenaria]